MHEVTFHVAIAMLQKWCGPRKIIRWVRSTLVLSQNPTKKNALKLSTFERQILISICLGLVHKLRHA